jgi:hypothetical protein
VSRPRRRAQHRSSPGCHGNRAVAQAETPPVRSTSRFSQVQPEIGAVVLWPRASVGSTRLPVAGAAGRPSAAAGPPQPKAGSGSTCAGTGLWCGLQAASTARARSISPQHMPAISFRRWPCVPATLAPNFDKPPTGMIARPCAVVRAPPPLTGALVVGVHNLAGTVLGCLWLGLSSLGALPIRVSQPFSITWRPLRDSSPCYQRERVMSEVGGFRSAQPNGRIVGCVPLI